ncbi:MAG: hypothetical protein LBE61_17100 [Burkholderiaceae bacterium]|jgi:RHS repeat-associated protein|nr:hypothetical protein [Burkholderiaceae bacterium]
MHRKQKIQHSIIAKLFSLLLLSSIILWLDNVAAQPRYQLPKSYQNSQDVLDWEDYSPHPLAMSHHYRSSNILHGDLSENSYALETGMGKGWTHPWSGRIIFSEGPSIVTDEKWNNTAIIILGNGSRATFYKVKGNNSPWISSSGNGLLSKNSNGTWVYESKDSLQKYTFGTAGNLFEISDKNGRKYIFEFEANGYVKTIANAFNRKLIFNYSNNKLISVTLPNNHVIHYRYHQEGSLASADISTPARQSYIYDKPGEVGLLTGINDSYGNRLISFDYNSERGLVYTYRNAVGNGKYQISLFEWGQVSGRGGFAAKGVSNPKWHQFQIYKSRPSGASNTSTMYQGASAGVQIEYQTPPGNYSVKSTQFDLNKLPIVQQDFKNNVTEYQWDTVRRLPISTTKAVGTVDSRATSIAWHSSFDKPVSITQPGKVDEFSYDAVGNLTEWKSTDTTTNITRQKSWQYNANSLVTRVTDEASYHSDYIYDAFGNVSTFTNALGQVHHYLSDGAGRPIAVTSPSGVTLNYAYDPTGKVISVNAGGMQTTYAYNLDGTLRKATLPSGRELVYQYDASRRNIGWTDNLGNKETLTLDPKDRVTQSLLLDSLSIPVFNKTTTYNDLNKVSQIKLGGTQYTDFQYDANGDLYYSSQPLSQSRFWTRDALRRVVKVSNLSNTTLLFKYNTLDFLSQATDYKGVATNFEHDAFGNRRHESTPDTGAINSTYDIRGLLTSSTDATGRTIGVDRDALGRITKLNYNDSTSSLLKHDLSGAAYNTPDAPNASIGSLSEVQDPGVTTQYQRDALSRVVRKTQTLAGGETRSTSYTYVPAGQGGAGGLKSITYPSGKTLEYSYDSTGLITGMAWNGAPLVSAFKWSPLGVPTEWTWPGIKMSPTDPSALLESRQYDTAGQLIHSGLLDLTWDAAGRVTAIAQSHMIPGSGSDPAQRGMVSSSFNYNATGNLTASAHALMATPAVTLPAGVTLPDLVGYTSLGYSYDANGNRTSGVFTKATGVGTPLKLTRTYATTTGTNRLASVTTSSSAGGTIPAKTYEYDASGSLTNAAGQYLHYGANGRVAKLTNTSSSTDPLAVSYVYNSSSQRVLKTDARTAGTTSSEHAFYSDDDGTNPLGFYSSQRSSNSAAPAGENDSTELLYLPTANGLMPIAAQINGRIYAIDTDHLNTPRRLTNADGQVAWQWLITGFGEVSPTTGAGGYLQPGSTVTAASYAPAVTFNLRYPGQQWDQETGLAYNINRYYDASSGRYIQADPIGLDGGWNRFAYVGGNPLSKTDPLGLFDVIRPGGSPSNFTDANTLLQREAFLRHMGELMQKKINSICKEDRTQLQAIFDKWQVYVDPNANDMVKRARGAYAYTYYGKQQTQFNRAMFDLQFGVDPSAGFIFAHEFRHLMSQNNRISPSIDVTGTGPGERDADAWAKLFTSDSCTCGLK